MPESDTASGPEAGLPHIDAHVLLGLSDDEYDLFRVPASVKAAADGFASELPLAAGGRAILSPPLFYETVLGAENTRRLNDLILAIAERRSDRVAGAFGVVEPKHGAQAASEIERIADRGFKGVTWSPRAQGVFADDGLMVDLVQRAWARGLVSMIHTTPQSINEALSRIWHLSAQCPGVPMVILGGLGSWDTIHHIATQGLRGADLYYDTSGIADVGQLPMLARLLGEDRLLFGSGARQRGTLSAAGRSADEIAGAPLTEKLKHRILRQNAASLLGLDG